MSYLLPATTPSDCSTPTDSPFDIPTTLSSFSTIQSTVQIDVSQSPIDPLSLSPSPSLPYNNQQHTQHRQCQLQHNLAHSFVPPMLPSSPSIHSNHHNNTE
eukprot:TRINITY_DN14738_c0_g1_i2.p1 TRINITY_DN14738_c0_g1~~TRINITY_DN14738_c0_g1_i2.p1  ORF type:complete len:101 (-),score=9.82 TRINITY_DN14738_c0_g1_i2:81-383(-)